MIHLAIFASLAACLCFGAVLFGQIRRIDSIEDRLAYSFGRVEDHFERIDRNDNINLRDMSKLDKRLKQLERATERVTACSVAEFSPGDVHPFAPDAFVSTTDCLA